MIESEINSEDIEKRDFFLALLGKCGIIVNKIEDIED